MNATVASVEEVAGGVADPVYLAVSARWADARFHLHSETRDLVRRATTPVLVVPRAADPPPHRVTVSGTAARDAGGRRPSRRR